MGFVMRRWLFFAVLGAIGAGCGDDNDGDSSSEPVVFDEVVVPVACENGFDVQTVHAVEAAVWATNDVGVYWSADEGMSGYAVADVDRQVPARKPASEAFGRLFKGRAFVPFHENSRLVT
jgi:hypothetical protein